MRSVTVCEFDALVCAGENTLESNGVYPVPALFFRWLQEQALRSAEMQQAPWLQLCQRHGQAAIRVLNYVGVVRAPDGFCLEVLPKVAPKNGDHGAARNLLIEMLRCLRGFRHIRAGHAPLRTAQMPLLEIFIAKFLQAAEFLVKHGLRSEYVLREDNLSALRGKIVFAEHIKQNLCRGERFFAAYDEFCTDRPENRLIHAALRLCLALTRLPANIQLAQKLCFAFSEVPMSTQPHVDFKLCSRSRDMARYAEPLSWARLILQEQSPITGKGSHETISLLFPMEALFEAFVIKHLKKQLNDAYTLKPQAKKHALVKHEQCDWFWLKPDTLILEADSHRMVLDAKWKCIDENMNNSKEKYGITQNDLYQMYAYGQNYLAGQGHMALIYPMTEAFKKPLPVFEFSSSPKLLLWVLPFCLKSKVVMLPKENALAKFFENSNAG